MASGMTYWTIAIESLVALAFLFPTRLIGSWLRHIFLMVFILTTYAIAPVLGFGYVLVAFGAAQVEENQEILTMAYAFCFAAITAYSAPWRLVASYLSGSVL